MENYTILNKINSPADLKALSREETETLCTEIREFMCDKVKKQGGHLASNLGVVELTLAIDRVFDPPKDHIIFDVGHQSYVHKIVTGRRDMFDTLRTPGGLSGFPKRSESEYDSFGTGHASTSLSAALGFAQADRLKGNGSYSICIVGDGAYTGGEIHEALNNCEKNLNLIVILNENEMSISHNIGAFAHQISRIRTSKSYYKTKRVIIRIVQKIPLIGRFLFRKIAHAKTNLKNRLYGSNYFEELGLYYLGPVDGHDTERLERLLVEAKNLKQATLIHVITTKGKGYEPAEIYPDEYHGISPSFTVPQTTFSKEFGKNLSSMAEEHDDIVAITAAMSQGTGLDDFKKSFPDRFFDVGIAEEHAMTFAAALAADGIRPFFAVYSTFLQRSYDQLLHDVALQGLPVVVCIDRAGIACADGATHNGIFDVAFTNTIPGLTVYAPSDFKKLNEAMSEAYGSSSPVLIRYPNDTELSLPDDFEDHGIFYSGLTEDSECTVITYGKIAKTALEARSEEPFSLIILEKLRPYDEISEELKRIIPENNRIVFLEEGQYNGGAGMILEKMLGRKMKILAIKNSFAEGEKEKSLLESCGISKDDLLFAIRNK